MRFLATWQTTPKKRALLAKVGFYLYRMGNVLQDLSGHLLRFLNASTTDENTDWFQRERITLHKNITSILKRQQNEYTCYAYFHGYPYQGLSIAGIYGERPTEERFETYKLATFFNSNDHILDIGCNCGFLGIYTAFRLNCTVTGLDINPYMIEIGQNTANHLKIAHKTHLFAQNFHDFQPNTHYSGVFSCATHWTDDENYRVALEDHFRKIHSFLKPNGLLIFESHCNDVGQKTFYDSLENAKEFFDIQFLTHSDNNAREVYVMRKKDTHTNL